MAKLPSMLTIAWFLLFLTIINQSFSARTLGDPSPRHHHDHRAITFNMQDLLSGTHPSSRPVTAKVNGQLPFSKPLGLFPPNGGIPVSELNPPIPVTGLSTQTLDLSGIGVSFPALATLQELELGTVTVIDEDLFEGSVPGAPLLGKTQGIYVASSEDGSSHMMAMTAVFANNEFKDGLRFFGVHRTDVSESHIAVIGGTGKYHGSNGYATIKAVSVGSNAAREESEGANKLLLFNVYLSY